MTYNHPDDPPIWLSAMDEHQKLFGQGNYRYFSRDYKFWARARNFAKLWYLGKVRVSK